MNNETQSSIPDAVTVDQIIGKRRKIDEDGQFVVSVYNENTSIPAKLMEMPIVAQSAEKEHSKKAQKAIAKSTPSKQKTQPSRVEFNSTAKKSTAKKA